MSLSAAHESKLDRKNCQFCQARKARFAYRGVVRADRDHTFCFECYRAERERRRAQRLADVVMLQPLRMPLPGTPVIAAATLSQRKVAHRRAMLAHLTSQL